MYCIHVYTYCMTHCTVPHHTMFVLCTDAVITLCCTIILCCTCWNYDCTMQHTVYCTVRHRCGGIPCIWVWLWWGEVMSFWEGVGLIWLEILMWLTQLYHCLHGDIDLAWRHSVHSSQARHKINMYPIKIPYPHPHSPRHMMATNRAWNVSKPLCKDMRSARKRVFNPGMWHVAEQV